MATTTPANRESVKILHSALAEDGDDIILRGVIDPDSLSLLQAADYQREIVPGASQDGLMAAFQDPKKSGRIPDIFLGMRGAVTRDHGNVFYLQDPVFIVDGLQRVSAAKRVMEETPDIRPHIGATIHFSTNETWEREMFRILNADRLRVSPNILARNMRHEWPVVDTIHTMATKNDPGLVLNGRVCWAQRMKRNDVIYATTLLKTIGWLHSHKGPGRTSKLTDLVPGLQKIMERVGVNVFRDNIRTFFDLVDRCWGIKDVVYHGAPHLKGPFLTCLARVFSTHHTVFFKDSRRLVIDRHTASKLRLFPVNDPQIANLAGAGGQSANILYNMMIQHINRGRRTRRLIETEILVDDDVETEDNDN